MWLPLSVFSTGKEIKMKGKSVHSQMFPSLQEIGGKKELKKWSRAKCPKSCRKSWARTADCSPSPSLAALVLQRGEGALCSFEVMPEGSCAPLTCSSDTSNILVDIQPEGNAASSSSNSHKVFSEVFAASTGSITAEKKGVSELLVYGLVPTRVFWVTGS